MLRCGVGRKGARCRVAIDGCLAEDTLCVGYYKDIVVEENDSASAEGVVFVLAKDERKLTTNWSPTRALFRGDDPGSEKAFPSRLSSRLNFMLCFYVPIVPWQQGDEPATAGHVVGTASLFARSMAAVCLHREDLVLCRFNVSSCGGIGWEFSCSRCFFWGGAGTGWTRGAAQRRSVRRRLTLSHTIARALAGVV